ncbi:hypothetical protein [Cellulomonas sp.]|uniref:hypothetical protein n=1 Tax=Cellulomonas sp. TaxID=40001 RepID=UPI002810F16D|nr:hypothetical protein [Cellulomonas sp.]
MSDLLVPQMCRATQAESMQISDCIHEAPGRSLSPIDEFETAMVALARTAGMMSGAEHPEVLGEMLVVAAVATTESYFRSLLGVLAANCPITQRNVRSETISMGAVLAYPRDLVALALVERALFSSGGVIEAQLKRFLKYEIKSGSELKSAIASFEIVCLSRHAAAHWRGYLDSAGLRTLQVATNDVTSYRIVASEALVQRAFAACDHLVHTANQVLTEFTVRKWVESQLLLLDGTDEEGDLARCDTLVQIFGSSSDSAAPKSGADLLARLVEEVGS